MSEVLSHYGHGPVLVLPSPALEQSMAKNHLTFTELLKPFGEPPLLSSAMHFRTPNRQQYQLKRWGVRFTALHEMEPMVAVVGERMCDEVCKSTAIPKQRQTDAVKCVDDVQPFLKAVVDPVPWYTRYRHDLLGSLRFSEQELLDQPLAIMIAVSSTEGAEAIKFIDTCRSNRLLPASMQKGVYDSNIAHCVVVVHDKHSESADSGARQRAVDMLKRVQQQYGSADVMSVVLELNSMPAEMPNPSQRDLWSAYVLQGRLMRACQVRGSEVKAAMEATQRWNAAAGVGGQGTGGGGGVNGDGSVMNMAGDDSFNAMTDDNYHHLPLNIVDFANTATTAAGGDWKNSDNNNNNSSPTNSHIANPTSTTVPLSTSPPPPSTTPSPFAAYLSSLLQCPPEQGRGQYLAPFDIDNLSVFVHSFLTSHVLPSLEQRFVLLTQQVNAVRGSFNRLKAGWKAMVGGGGSGSKAGWNPQLNTFTLGSMESQARMLADLSFVMQDWESAEVCYGYVLRDYNPNDRAQHPHLASANEMMALTLTHIDPSRYHQQIGDHLQSARSTYMLSIKDSRRAARVEVLSAECYRIRQPTLKRWKQGIYVTINAAKKQFTGASQQRTVRAALQMEYAAYLFLQPPAPALPLVRKYALSLLLAGRMYRYFGYTQLEVRCDQAASALYADKTWRAIDDHVYDKLGKELYSLQQYQQSIHFFVQLIGRPRNINMLTAQPVNPLIPRPSAAQQQRFLADLVYAVQRWYGVLGEVREVPGLRLPCFVDESVSVVTNNEVTVPSCYAMQAWNTAARTQRMTLNAELNNKPLFTPAMPMYKESDRGCVVNERITLSVRVLNPLQIDLEVSSIRLRARHTSSDGVVTTDAYVESGELPSSVLSSASPYPTGTMFVINTQDVVLPAGEAIVLSLHVLPLQQGTLQIDGVQWLTHSLHGYHTFALPPRAVPVARGGRGQPTMQPDPSLTIAVQPPAPLLGIRLDGIPAVCYHGEYVKGQFVLTNSGAMGLTKLSVRISHPGFILLGRDIADPPATTSTTLSASASTPSLSVHHKQTATSPVHPYDWNDVIVHLPVTLQPGQSLSIPVWLRGALEGQQQLSFLFRYESVEGKGGWRLGYVECGLHVRALLGVRVFHKPSFAEVKDSLLGVDIHDRQAETTSTETSEEDEMGTVRIDSISVLSKTWVIATIGQHPATHAPGSGKPASRSLSQHDLHTSSRQTATSTLSMAPSEVESVLSPHESLLMFARITNLPTLALSSPLQQSLCPTHFSSVRFTSPGPPSTVDCTRPPYSNLLGMEKALLMEEERQSLIINPAATIADIGAPNKFDLIITWTLLSSPTTTTTTATGSSGSGGGGVRYGFYHVPGVAIMKVLPSACPLKVHLSYPTHITLPPSHSPTSPATTPASSFPLSVPISLSIRNILDDTPISFLFETLPPEEEFDPIKRAFRTSTSSTLPASRYMWRGLTRSRVIGLKGGEEADVLLCVDVLRCGEYNLNRFRFTVEVGGGKKPRVFFFPLQHLIRVERAGEEGVEDGRGEGESKGGSVRVMRVGDGAIDGPHEHLEEVVE